MGFQFEYFHAANHQNTTLFPPFIIHMLSYVHRSMSPFKSDGRVFLCIVFQRHMYPLLYLFFYQIYIYIYIYIIFIFFKFIQLYLIIFIPTILLLYNILTNTLFLWRLLLFFISVLCQFSWQLSITFFGVFFITRSSLLLIHWCDSSFGCF